MPRDHGFTRPDNGENVKGHYIFWNNEYQKSTDAGVFENGKIHSTKSYEFYDVGGVEPDTGMRYTPLFGLML